MTRVADRARGAHLAAVPDTEREPTAAELDAIEAEWPLIAAEMAVLAAETMLIHAPLSQIAWRAHRRAVNHLLAVARDLTARGHLPQEVA